MESEKDQELDLKGGKNILSSSSKKSGSPPGSLVYIGKEKENSKAIIEVMDYSPTKLIEHKTDKVDEVFKYKDTKTISWLNVTGIHDKETIKKIGEHYKLHPLLLEDLMNTRQRPKLEIYKNEIFMVLKMIYYNEEKQQIDTEQVSLIVGKNFLISFLEDPGDVFDPVRIRIREKNSKLRLYGSDFLLYALIDAIIDNYFIIIERIGEILEDIEKELVENPKPATLNKIYSLKRELILLRRSVWPLREVTGNLQKENSPFIKEETRNYLRDIYDHTLRVTDAVETSRELLSGMLDLYMSTISNKLNEIMKVLTIITTIFIPLSFIAGIYGMNFKHMPELDSFWGYPMVLGIMFIVAIGMILYFKRKKWT